MHKKQDFINLIIISSAIKTCCELWRTIASCGPPEKKKHLEWQARLRDVSAASTTAMKEAKQST